MKQDTFLLTVNDAIFRVWILDYFKTKIWAPKSYSPNENIQAILIPQRPYFLTNILTIETRLSHNNLHTGISTGYQFNSGGLEIKFTPLDNNRTEIDAKYNEYFEPDYQTLINAIGLRWIIQHLAPPPESAQPLTIIEKAEPEPWRIIQEQGMTPKKRGQLKIIWELRNKGETWEKIACECDFKSITSVKRHYRNMTKLTDS